MMRGDFVPIQDRLSGVIVVVTGVLFAALRYWPLVSPT